MERPWKAALAGSASKGSSSCPAPACCSTAANRYGALQSARLAVQLTDVPLQSYEADKDEAVQTSSRSPRKPAIALEC